MKSILPFVLFSISLCQTGLSQSNFPFPTEHAEWVYYQVNPIIGPTDYYFVSRDFLNGDSTFMGKSYSKVFTQSLCRCICDPPINYMSTNMPANLLGGIREEDGKVYFTKFGAGTGMSYFDPITDTLLYDFTAQPGDTIPYANNTKLVVTAIDTAADGRALIHFNIYPPGYPSLWQEGIGSAGLLQTTAFLIFNGFCFSDEVPSDCPIPCAVTAAEEPNMLPQIRINPRLATDFVSIEYSDPSEQYALQIFSIDGALLDSHHRVLSGDRIEIGHLPTGVLVFQFLSQQGVVWTTKIVRQE